MPDAVYLFHSCPLFHSPHSYDRSYNGSQLSTRSRGYFRTSKLNLFFMNCSFLVSRYSHNCSLSLLGCRAVTSSCLTLQKQEIGSCPKGLMALQGLGLLYPVYKSMWPIPLRAKGRLGLWKAAEQYKVSCSLQVSIQIFSSMSPWKTLWSVMDSEVLKDTEAFTCVMYGQICERWVNNRRGWDAHHRIKSRSLQTSTWQRKPSPTH